MFSPFEAGTFKKKKLLRTLAFIPGLVHEIQVNGTLRIAAHYYWHIYAYRSTEEELNK